MQIVLKFIQNLFLFFFLVNYELRKCLHNFERQCTFHSHLRKRVNRTFLPGHGYFRNEIARMLCLSRRTDRETMRLRKLKQHHATPRESHDGNFVVVIVVVNCRAILNFAIQRVTVVLCRNYTQMILHRTSMSAIVNLHAEIRRKTSRELMSYIPW